MSFEPIATSKNDSSNKVEPVICGCGLLWSLAHQFTYLRLADKTGDNEYEMIDLFAARAKRIAATYARFYLESEDGGDTSKKGRYYWMALGAFASKTVACLLETWQLNAMYIAIKAIPKGLGKGNLWLFTDIAASHWFYNHFPENFQQGMMCGSNRNVNTLVDTVKTITRDLPWAAESIGTIKNFQPSGDIIEGFKLIEQVENEKRPRKKPDLQLAQLIAIAKHEQGAVLQPLIYEDPGLAAWTQRERNWFRWASPTYQLSFSHACDSDDPELKSVAPDELIIENLQSRMDWITDAANIFHGLMQTRRAYMEKELATMAGWVSTPDAAMVY